MTIPPPEPPPHGFPEPPTQHVPVPPSDSEAQHEQTPDRLSALLIGVIVVALVLAGLLGAELYARHVADSIVSKAVSCVVQDGSKVSFGLRPFLIQHLTHSYRDMVVDTAGNQIREAKGMTLHLRLDDIRLEKTADGAGTLGALDADVSWSADGIKQTAQTIIPFLGGLVSGVNTDPGNGTIELQGPLGTVTVMPTVSQGQLQLQVAGVSGLGFALPRETAQPALDAFTTALTANLPMGIHAESVAVTDGGVTARFIARDATIPNGQADPCFQGI
ncbi:MAG: DUF2993 domain-containing protein [Mycobacteriaceae bacterium]